MVDPVSGAGGAVGGAIREGVVTAVEEKKNQYGTTFDHLMATMDHIGGTEGPAKTPAQLKAEQAAAAKADKQEADSFGKWAGGFIKDTENDIVKAGGIKADSISTVFKTAVAGVPDDKPAQPAPQQVGPTVRSSPPSGPS